MLNKTLQHISAGKKRMMGMKTLLLIGFITVLLFVGNDAHRSNGNRWNKWIRILKRKIDRCERIVELKCQTDSLKPCTDESEEDESSESAYERFKYYAKKYQCCRVVLLRCKRKGCYPRCPMVDNGIVTERVGTNKKGDSITFKCSLGFDLQGEATITCEKSGKNYEWSPLPTCKIVECSPETPDVQNGGVQSRTGTNKYEDSITYECDDGYEINGSDTITCGADKQWSPAPTCTKVECSPETPDVQNGGVQSRTGTNKFEDSITYTCNDGYEINGSDTITCGADQQWSPVPTCTKVECSPETPDVQNGGVQSRTGTNKFEDSITYTCNDGFVINGASTITCGANGQWSPIPTCIEDTPVQECEPLSSSTPAFANDNLQLTVDVSSTSGAIGTIVTVTVLSSREGACININQDDLKQDVTCVLENGVPVWQNINNIANLLFNECGNPLGK